VEADADEANKIYRIIADDLLEALEYDPRNREFLLELTREASRICVKMWEGKYKSCYEMEAEFTEASRRVWEKMRKVRGDEAFLEFLGYTSALHSLLYAIWSEIYPPTYITQTRASHRAKMGHKTIGRKPSRHKC
jgi:hypothetical protein